MFFLSSMCVPAAHADVMHNSVGNTITLALEIEVVKLLQDNIRNSPTHANDYIIGSVLHIASAGHYNAPDKVVERHYDFLRAMVDMRGGFDAYHLTGDLPKLIIM